MIHKNLSIIVAIAENFAIGKNNQLLFHLSSDLKRFKQITTGHPIIMGKNTYLSLPHRPLPNRTNIVISRSIKGKLEGCILVPSIDSALNLINPEQEAFIIGGEAIYQQFYPLVGRLYLTVVSKHFEADTFFPEIDFNEWIEESKEDFFDKKNNFKYSYQTLIRK